MSDPGGTDNQPPEHPRHPDPPGDQRPPSDYTFPGQQPGGYPGQQPGVYPAQPGGAPTPSGGYTQPGGYPPPGGYTQAGTGGWQAPSPGGYQPQGGYPGAGGWQQPGWQMGPGYSTPQTSGKAIAALVCAIGSVIVFPIVLAIVGFILALVGRRDIDRSGGRLGGRGMCLASIIISVVSFIGWTLFIVAIVVAASNNSSNSGNYGNYNALRAVMAPLIS